MPHIESNAPSISLFLGRVTWTIKMYLILIGTVFRSKISVLKFQNRICTKTSLSTISLKRTLLEGKISCSVRLHGSSSIQGRVTEGPGMGS